MHSLRRLRIRGWRHLYTKDKPFPDILEVKSLDWEGGIELIETDGNYIYVGGVDLKDYAQVFRFDKLDKSLSRIATYESWGLRAYNNDYPPAYYLTMTDMAFNMATGHLWIVSGIVYIYAGALYPRHGWWIEIVDPSTMTPIKSIDLEVEGAVIISDFEGYMYLLAEGILKLDKDGSIIARKRLENEPILSMRDVINDIIITAGHEKRRLLQTSSPYIRQKPQRLKQENP